jgi:PAS domain S-box-containing protein
MKKPTRILIVEDLAADADLAKHAIRKVLKDCEFQVVETRKDFLTALVTFQPDLVLSDYSLPHFDGMKALKLTLKHAPLTPLIICTGSISEDVAVECMKAGANNYILKENLKRLGPAVVHALEERDLQMARKQAEEKYQAIVENSLEGVFQSTPEGRYLNVNSAMARIYGYNSPQEMIETVKHIANQIYVDPSGREEFVKLLHLQNTVENYEQRNYRKDGSIIWTSTSARVVRDTDGNVLYYEGFLQDITDRKRAEEALELSERRFRALIENGLDDISLIAPDGTLLWESPSTIRNLGYAPDAFVGHNIFELMHPDDLKWTQKLYQKLIQEPGIREQGEFRLRRSDGTWRWVEAIATNMLNEPSVNAIVINYRDITERKQTEAALRESQVKYQNLVETSHDLIWSIDAEGQFTFVNRAAKEIYGYEPEELLGRSFFEILDPQYYHPEDLEKFKKKIASADEFKEAETYVRHRDGRQIILSTNSIVARDPDGSVISVAGSSHDITIRKRVEEVLKEERNLLRTLIDNIPDRIYAMDMHGRKTLSNTADWMASGKKTMEDIIGKTDFDTYPSELAELFWQLDKSVLDSGQPIINYEEPGLDFEGNPVSILTTKVPLKDSEGKIIGLVGIGRDITERQRAEEALRESENRLILALAGAQMSVWEWNLQTNTIFWSPELFEIAGVTRGDLDETFDSFTNLIHPQDLNRVRTSAEKALADQSLFAEEFRIIRPDGQVRWLSNLGHAEYDSNHKSVRLIGTIQDITRRKQAEIERQSLLEISQGLANTKDLRELLKLIHHSIDRVVYAKNFFVVLYQQNSGLFEEIYSVDQYDPPAPPAQLEKSITSYVFRSGEPLLLTQVEFDELVEQGRVELVGTNSASWLGVPLKTSDRTIGVLVVQDYDNPNRYSERDRDFLASIAAQVAVAIERQRAEEALRASEERFRRYFELGLIGMAITSPAKGFIEVNDKICAILGYERDELSQITWAEITHPEDLAADIAQFNRVLAGEINSYSLDKRFIRKDGKIVDTTISVTCVRRADRSVDYVVALMEDITERKQAEEELRASEERFRQLADNIQEAFWITNAESGEEIYLSPAAETIWGCSIEELVSTPNAFMEIVLPEDKPRVVEALEKQKMGEKVEIEYRIMRPNGSMCWVWDRAFPIFDDLGKVKRIAGITADITERRVSEIALAKSQSRYRELFDNSPISIWEEDYSLVKKQIDLLLEGGVIDLRKYLSSHPEEVVELASLVTITDVNRASLELYEVEQKAQLLKGLTEALGKVNTTHFQEEILGLMSPLKRFIWEGTDQTIKGRQMEVIINGAIPYGYEEDWSKVIVSVIDITQRKRAEEEIRRRAQETSALLQTSLALTNLDLKATLQTIGNSAKTLFAADGCRIFLMQPDGESLRCVLALQENSEAFSDLRIKLGEGVTGAVAASGRPEIVNEMQNDPRGVQVADTLEEEQEAIMFAPLKERDRTIGVLSLRRAGSERPFQPDDLELLEAFASMAASAVSNARLFEETQHRLAELEALYENGLAVGRLLKPSEIGNRVIQTFARYLPWHHVTIRLRREESDELELVAFNLPNLKEEERANAEQHFIARINKVGQGLSGWVIQTGIPVRTGNVHVHPQYIDTHAGIQSGLYMPLNVGEQVIGVISVESEAPDAFTEQDERLLATLGNQAAIAFENARLYQAIEQELLERKRAEEALRISETHYRELADSITDIMFELDQDLHYTHWNKASEALTGIPAKDAIGKSMPEIFGELEEQTRLGQIYEGVLKTHQPRTFETTILLNGHKRPFEINAYPSTRGVSVVAKDVTDRKRSETIMQKRFELMEYSAHHTLDELMQTTTDEISELTSSPVGFFHFVNDDQITLGMQTWSTTTLQISHVPDSEGTHLPLDQAGVWAEAVRQRHPLIQNDYESLSKRRGLPQGHVPITREIVIPIIRNERIMAVMGIANKSQNYTPHDLEIAERLADYAWDITERKQMEVALEAERNQLARRVDERTADLSRANSNLARALRVKDEFLANMSHELRTPLNAILGLSESLAEQIAGPLNEKQQKYIATIGESGHHLLALINDILDLAKIEAGQITLDINKVDIHSVCQASLRMIKQLAQKKNQEVSLEIDDGLGLMWADERRLKQMIVNLLGNAVKFTPENGKLGLEVHGDEDANKISITVWDNGIGIKEADLARLFQPFVQLDSGLARGTTGTGLGLALVAQMARLHGGSINVLSDSDKGSRFTIVLPWEPALVMDAAARMKITGKFRAIKLDEANSPTVLLVEDTKEVTMMVRDYLELNGYKVVTAQDGVDAIVQAKLVRPDLILMDVQMPRMDGLEATRKLRSEPDFKHTPIIALTALAMPSDRERCLEAGMDEYISKPVNLKALIKIIQSCLFRDQEVKSQ